MRYTSFSSTRQTDYVDGGSPLMFSGSRPSVLIATNHHWTLPWCTPRWERAVYTNETVTHSQGHRSLHAPGEQAKSVSVQYFVDWTAQHHREPEDSLKHRRGKENPFMIEWQCTDMCVSSWTATANGKHSSCYWIASQASLLLLLLLVKGGQTDTGRQDENPNWWMPSWTISYWNRASFSVVLIRLNIGWGTTQFENGIFILVTTMMAVIETELICPPHSIGHFGTGRCAKTCWGSNAYSKFDERHFTGHFYKFSVKLASANA